MDKLAKIKIYKDGCLVINHTYIEDVNMQDCYITEETTDKGTVIESLYVKE